MPAARNQTPSSSSASSAHGACGCADAQQHTKHCPLHLAMRLGRSGSLRTHHRRRRSRSHDHGAATPVVVVPEPDEGTETPNYNTVDSREAFWNELEAIITLPDGCGLKELDNTLRMFVTFCGAYHDIYLQSPIEMQGAISFLLESELFEYHYERMVGVMMGDAQENTNPHELYIWYHIILFYGQRHPSLFRSHRKWQKLLPTLGEVVGLDYEENYVLGLPPIESRLRLPATTLMYEVCRVQMLDPTELAQFDDTFIDHLFDLVETTRDQQDERLNYAVISLIVALNEQFMVSTLSDHKDRRRNKQVSAPASVSATNLSVTQDREGRPGERRRSASVTPAPRIKIGEDVEDTKKNNRVLVVLMRRLGSSKTFGENVIFMLNRAENTPEGLCLQLLILKILYLLFTTPGTQEYFFTNDMRVLLDVFVRELVDLPEEHEALRHTYLRVMFPLLSHTQIRRDPYKRPQIRLILQSLISNDHIHDINSTTRRLVERCLQAANENPTPDANHSLSPDSAMAMHSIAASLPAPKATPYLERPSAPGRVASLIDVSGASERPPSAGSTHSLPDRSNSTTPAGPARSRRPAPAPPMKRRQDSSCTTSSNGSSVDDLTPSLSPDLVKLGERGVPPPIIEVQPTGWITFSA